MSKIAEWTNRTVDRWSPTVMDPSWSGSAYIFHCCYKSILEDSMLDDQSYPMDNKSNPVALQYASI